MRPLQLIFVLVLFSSCAEQQASGPKKWTDEPVAGEKPYPPEEVKFIAMKEIPPDKTASKQDFLPPVVINDHAEDVGYIHPEVKGSAVSTQYFDMGFSYPVQSKWADAEIEEIFPPLDQVAEFPGGKNAMMKFFTDNIQMPETAKQDGVNGKCYIGFSVSETGRISDVKVLKGLPDCGACDDESVRVVRLMPDWIPAKANEKPVKSLYNLPINYKAD